jgi:tRNA-binding EMAP/Myf-like protein
MLGSVEQWWVKYFVNSSACVQQCSTTNKMGGSTVSFASFYISDKRICFLCMCCTRISFVAGYSVTPPIESCTTQNCTMQAYCKTCDSVQEVERVDETGDAVFCVACGEEFTPSTAASTSDSSSLYNNYRIGKVLSVGPIAKQKELKKVLVDVIGDDDGSKAVQIVTNAKYIEAGWKVVVALENAVVPAGAVLDEDPDAIQIKATAVGGVMSRGMLCDSPMLKWTGGAKGMVQQLPDSFNVGDAPPSARPRV